MLDEFEQDQAVRMLMYEIMMVMYRHGMREIHVGGLMRMLGVANENAAEHDHEVIVIDTKFAKYVDQITQPRGSDQTLH